MQYTNDTKGTIEVDGDVYLWELRRQQRPVGKNAWEGIAIAFRHQDYKREAVAQYPALFRPNGSPNLEKQRIDLDVLANTVRSIIEAGWEPASRGKTVNFDVDADGN